MKQKKYVATVVVPSDDFVLTDDAGNEYHPHAGEKVTLRKDLPLLLMDIHEDMTNAEYVALVDKVLLRQVRGWTWTDDDGEPLPAREDKGAFVDAVRLLTREERNYIVGKIYELMTVPNAPVSP